MTCLGVRSAVDNMREAEMARSRCLPQVLLTTDIGTHPSNRPPALSVRLHTGATHAVSAAPPGAGDAHTTHTGRYGGGAAPASGDAGDAGGTADGGTGSEGAMVAALRMEVEGLRGDLVEAQVEVSLLQDAVRQRDRELAR